MKPFSFNSIFSRLTFWFLFLALIPLVFSLSTAYNQSVDIIEKSALNTLIAVRDLKVIQLKGWLTERDGDMKIMQDETDFFNIESLINKSSYNQNDNAILNLGRNHLKKYLKNYAAYSELYIINPINGKILISTNVLMEGKDQSLEDSFTIPMQSREFTIKDIYYSQRMSQFTMDYSIPIFNKGNSDNPIIGIIVANIDLDNSLYKILNDRIGLGKTGETLIVNKDKFAISQLRWFNDATLKLQITAKPVVEAIKGKTGILKTIDYRGNKILSAYTYIPEMGWGFVCKQDLYELNASIRKMTLNFIVVFIVIAMIIILFSFSISNSISKPIVMLNISAQKISTGDYSIKNLINSQDEIGLLAASINEMAQSIQTNINVEKGITKISNKTIEKSTLSAYSLDLLEILLSISETHMGVFYILNDSTQAFDPLEYKGLQKELLKSVNAKNPKGKFGQTLLKKTIFKLRDFSEDSIFNQQTATKFNLKEIITIPILNEDLIVAFVSLLNNQHFSKESYIIFSKSQVNLNISYANLISNLRVGVLAENVLKINDYLDKKTKQLKNQNSDLLKQKAIAEEANKELEAFSYSVSHDLRAPLRHIDGFTKLLFNKNKNIFDEKSKLYFDNIISSSKQMNTLIDDLLVFSRMGRKDVKKGKINMKKMVNDAILTFSVNIKKNNISIVIDEMPEVNADASLLIQVWINLISNAIKFSSKIKNPKIHIGFDKDTNNNSVYFIKDNGVGFNQKFVNKIFGVFQRLHSINEFPGTGIGLANVKRIITKHGGNIWAEGEMNKGASFFFTLPNA